MTKTIAIAGAAAAAVVTAVFLCARQGPRIEEKALEGTLEDVNETVAVVKDAGGREHMFWLPLGIQVEAQKGERVLLHYSTGKNTGRKVKNLLDIRKM